MRTFVKMSLMLFVSAVLGAVLMMLVYMLPVENMRRNVRSSIDMLMKEGVRNSWAAFSYKRPPRHMKSKETVDNVINSARPYSIIDGYTDGIMLSIATYNAADNNSALHNAMINPHLSYKSSSEFSNPVETLSKSLNDNLQEEARIVQYSRYWHGYLICLKPLLTFMSVSGIRVMNFIIQFMLMIIVMLKMSEKIGKAYALAFALAVVVIDPISASMCLAYADVYYITLIVMIVMLSKNDSIMEKGLYCFVFMFAGIFTSFFDLLSYPFVSFGIPAILYLLINKNMKLSRRVLNMIQHGLSWGFGYFGMWASKWCITSMLTGQNVFINGINAAVYRTSGNVKGINITWKWLFSYVSSMHLFLPCVLFLCILIAISALLIYISMRKKNISAADVVPLCLTFFYPFVWYSVLKQHSIIHYFFTHKVLSVSVFALACLIITCSGYKQNGKSE